MNVAKMQKMWRAVCVCIVCVCTTYSTQCQCCMCLSRCQVLVQVYHLDGLNWDVANEKQELQLTVPSTGESAIFKSKQILLLKNALSKFMQIRVNSLPELG